VEGIVVVVDDDALLVAPNALPNVDGVLLEVAGLDVANMLDEADGVAAVVVAGVAHRLELVVTPGRGAVAGACEKVGFAAKPIDAKMSSSCGGAAGFFGCAVTGFFFPRLVMAMGMTPPIDGAVTVVGSAIAAPLPTPMDAAPVIVDPPSGGGAPADTGAGAIAARLVKCLGVP
jgi:hypothetical protein